MQAKKSRKPAGDPAPVRRRNRDATQKALLKAAVECFAEKGFDAATTQSVAARAGVSEGLIHRYFKSKDGLLLALMQHFLDDSAGHPALTAGSSETLESAMRGFFETAFTHHTHNTDAMRVMVSRAIIRQDIGKMMGDDIWQRHVAEIAGVLRQYKQSGSIKAKEDIEAAAFVLSAFSFVLGFMGSHVFKFEKKRLHEIGGWLATTLSEQMKQSARKKTKTRRKA